ncbi:hypothetical protein AB0H07_39100 [Streptomyces sp. NPDC021354]|uniref:hypothetical protein n=1 Tax=Streptomyces sp. NPDC021354 TaxID=3154793 RepID=UPI00340ED495
MFRRNRSTTNPAPAPTPAPAPAADRPEVIAITLEHLQVLERVLHHADERLRIWRPDISPSTRTSKLLAALYQRAGTASVVQPNPELARIPFYVSDFVWLEAAIQDIETYHGTRATAQDGRNLLNRFNALLGQARAITYMGGTPVFDPNAPQPACPPLPGYTPDS